MFQTQRVGKFPPVSGYKAADDQIPFCQGSRLVGEQDIQAARCFDPDQLSDHHMVFEHPEHIGGQNNGDHHRQSFRHGNDHHGDRQDCGVKQILHHDREAGKLREDKGQLIPVVD